MDFKPFENEKDVLEIGDLTIENRTDMISIFGNHDFTVDEPGLEGLLALQAVINASVEELKKLKAINDLPEKSDITLAKQKTKNSKGNAKPKKIGSNEIW